MIFLPITDSTNNYAMRRINDGLSVHGDIIWTHFQSEGKGQRNKSWSAEVGQSALFSIIIHEHLTDISIFQLNIIVALAVRNTISNYIINKPTCIKWPNDIYIGDKKTCGILIENSFRGSQWNSSVIGIGINVGQSEFDSDLPNATSLFMESNHFIEIENLIKETHNEILKQLPYYGKHPEEAFELFNKNLYKRDHYIKYYDQNYPDKLLEGKVIGVDEYGKLWIELEGKLISYEFGQVIWKIPSN